MSAFALKIIACISMLLCHIPFVFPETRIPLFYIGRFAFPIYAFLISEGYSHTKNVKKYLIRLIVFAVISQIPAYLLFVGTSFTRLYFNIFFTLSAGLATIIIYEKFNNNFISYPVIIALAVIAEVLGFDYGFIGVLMIFVFHRFKDTKAKMFLIEIFLMILLYLEKSTHYVFTIRNLVYLTINLVCTILSLIFIAIYNGKQGKTSKNIKLAFYSFYPVHLIILLLIKFMIR